MLFGLIRLLREMGSDEGSGGGNGGAGAGAGAGGEGSGDGAGAAGGDKGGQGDKGKQVDGQEGAGGDKGKGATPSPLSIPEAFKEKGWAKKLEGKTLEDVFKHIDNQESLLGKKRVVPNLAELSDEERKDFFTQLRGNTEIKDYKFGDGAHSDFSKAIAEQLFNIGIPANVANPVLEAITAKAAEIAEERVSEAGYTKEMTTIFGEDWKPKAGAITNLMKEIMSPEDMAAIDKGKASNEEVGRMYRLAKAFQEKYGAKESGGAGEGGNGGGGSIEDRRKAIRAKMSEMRKSQYKQADYDALQKQLNATYQ